MDATSSITLKTGVSVDTLYSDLDAATLAKIKEFSTDGFTTKELQELKEDGVDVSLIEKNAAKTTTAASKKSDASASEKAKEIAAKYPASGTNSGDPYTMGNPELVAFKKAMGDGIVKELAKEGFSKNQIVGIIGEAFPSIGIKNLEGDKYSVPAGHDDEAKALFKDFTSQLVAATGEDSAEIQALKAELLGLNKQIQANNQELRILEVNIGNLQTQIEATLEEAIDESKEIQEEQKADANRAVSCCLEAYTSSNGEMTYEEFQKNLSGRLDDIAGSANSQLSKVVGKMVEAERKMSTLTNYLGKMKNLIDCNKNLTAKVGETQTKLDEAVAKQAEEAANGCPDSCCQVIDPIGFTDGDVRYDFFVDKDNNNDLSNENEFLGAENGFNEVKALDTDGDGQVTKQELEAGNVKVVQTNADGSQKIVNVADVLKDGDSIDLNSYSAVHQDIGNGNTLEGTFNVNKDGKTLSGYQTLDDVDWLDANYNFSDKDEGIGRFAQGDVDNVTAEDYSKKYSDFQDAANKLRTKMDQVYSDLKLDAAMIQNGISAIAENEGKTAGKRIADDFEKTGAKEAAKEAEKAAEEKEKEEIKPEEK